MSPDRLSCMFLLNGRTMKPVTKGENIHIRVFKNRIKKPRFFSRQTTINNWG